MGLYLDPCFIPMKQNKEKKNPIYPRVAMFSEEGSNLMSQRSEKAY